jgi:hypothetical protein
MLTDINGRNLIGFNKFSAKIRSKRINIIHHEGGTIMDNTVTNIKKPPNSADTRPLVNAKENMANENSPTWHKAIADLTESFLFDFQRINTKIMQAFNNIVSANTATT